LDFGFAGRPAWERARPAKSRGNIMIAIEVNELSDNFNNIFDMVVNGETVIVSRPHNQNVIVISEHEYNIREKAIRNAEYLYKLDQSIQQVKEGKTISFTIEELEAFETMTPEEIRAFADNRKLEEGNRR
jgi:antitoxin YefM